MPYSNPVHFMSTESPRCASPVLDTGPLAAHRIQKVVDTPCHKTLLHLADPLQAIRMLVPFRECFKTSGPLLKLVCLKPTLANIFILSSVSPTTRGMGLNVLRYLSYLLQRCGPVWVVRTDLSISPRVLANDFLSHASSAVLHLVNQSQLLVAFYSFAFSR